MRRGSARPSVLCSQHPVGAETLGEGDRGMGGRKGEANWMVGMREDEKRIKGKVLPFKDLRTSGRRQSPTKEVRTVHVAHYWTKAWEGTGCLRGSSDSGWFLGE